jgi:hypothetical protein
MTKFEKFMMSCVPIQLFMFALIGIQSLKILLLGHGGTKNKK